MPFRNAAVCKSVRSAVAMTVDVVEVDKGRRALRALTEEDAAAPPNAQPRAFRIEAFA